MFPDTDTPGGANREGQLSWSNDDAAGSSWDRPDVWMHQVVIYDPKYVKKVLTSVEQPELAGVPEDYALDQNYPNPFDPSTNIKYQLSKNSQVTLTIYNLM